jgi:AcrR family transcriptional regulator
MGITKATPGTPGTAPAALGAPPVQARGRQKASTAGTDEKRERILQAAEVLFDRQGYANTTMEQIVQQLGVTKPYVYYYFRNKQEIFETLCWRPSVACFTAMDFPEDDHRPAHVQVTEGIERLIRATIEHHPAAFFPYREPQVFRPEYLAMQKKLANHFYDRMCALMEEARADGMLDFKETRLTALAACSLPGFLYHWYRPDGRLSPAEVVRELSQLAWRVLGLRTARRRPARPATHTQPPTETTP